LKRFGKLREKDGERVVLEGRVWGTRSGLLAGQFGLREIILEWSGNEALLVVCHTFREDKEAGGEANAKIGLISARRADRKEAAQCRGLEL
jgi:hypothetical protein